MLTKKIKKLLFKLKDHLPCWALHMHVCIYDLQL